MPSKPSRKPKRLSFVNHPGVREVVAAALILIAPPEDVSTSEWADNYRYLSPESSADAGPWNTSVAEYQREPMDCWSDSETSQIVLMWGSQTGKSDVLLNCKARALDIDPGPMLFLQPTVSLAQSWSKQRLTPMVRDSERLHKVFPDPKSRTAGNTIQEKTVPGGYVFMTGANAPTDLASRPIRYLLCDEIDRYPDSAGDEGAPTLLAEKRTSNFWNAKQIFTSTPGNVGQSEVAERYEKSDQRKYFLECPHCHEHQVLDWSNVEWDKKCDEHGKVLRDSRGQIVEHYPETAAIFCKHCGLAWSEGERIRAIRKGRWRATKPFRGIAGFHLSALCSPFLKDGITTLVKEWIFAYESGDNEKIKTFINTRLAEPFKEAGESVDATGLMARREVYEMDELPGRVLMITAGVDVQKDRLETQICGWGPGEECWVLEYLNLIGDPNKSAVWQALDEVRKRTYTTETGRPLRIRATCVDTGGLWADRVHQYCAKHFGENVLPIKGEGGVNQSSRLWPIRATKSSVDKGQYTVFMLGTNSGKSALYGRLGISEVGAGYIHFAEDLTEEYFEGLTAEEQRTKKRNGRPYMEWYLPDKKRNEPLDTWVYALAALRSQNVQWPRPEDLEKALAEQRKKYGGTGVVADPQTSAAPRPKSNPSKGRLAPRRRVSRSSLMNR